MPVVLRVSSVLASAPCTVGSPCTPSRCVMVVRIELRIESGMNDATTMIAGKGRHERLGSEGHAAVEELVLDQTLPDPSQECAVDPRLHGFDAGRVPAQQYGELVARAAPDRLFPVAGPGSSTVGRVPGAERHP